MSEVEKLLKKMEPPRCAECGRRFVIETSESSALPACYALYRPGMTGCTDGGCIFQDNSKGMHTNGGCQCEKALRRHPQGFKAIQTIHFLREQLKKANDK